MTIKEVVDKIAAERQTPGRFPVRLIFARNFSDYMALIGELSNVCDVTIDLAIFVKGDLLPNFKELKQELGGHLNRQVLVLSLGEYLRLCIKRETNKETAEFAGVWETIQAASSTTKYIIPFFGGRELFDQVIPQPNERQAGFLWELAEPDDDAEYMVTVYAAPAFSNSVRTDAANFQEWLEKWVTLFSDPIRRNFSLTTKLYKYANTTYGKVKIKIVDEPFTYVVQLVTDGNKLKKEWGNEQFWADIAMNAKYGEAFSETIKFMLNVGHIFDCVVSLARYEQLSFTERTLLWIWYKLYPSTDYYSYAIGMASLPEDIPIVIRDAIFRIEQWCNTYAAERVLALKALDVQYSSDYFIKIDKVQLAERRLSLLTYKTIEERAYAVKTVSGLLRAGSDVRAIGEMLKTSYPELAEYLSPSQDKNDDMSRYFAWYRHRKILNLAPEDMPYSVNLDHIDSRNKIINQNDGMNSFHFWVDGLGVEWLPLLAYKLKQLNPPITIIQKVAKSILPSETKYNHQWNKDAEKWDRLDKISHHGMPDDKDYYLCIARQIDIISEVAQKTSELLEQHRRVIITGDHGSSRLAALMFHKNTNFAIDPPKNSTVYAFGRFCELNDDADVPLTPSMERVELDGRTYVVMNTYEHFKQSGNAAGGNSEKNAVAGEIHGGMTPEEHLVPVVVVSREGSIEPLSPIEDKKPKAASINTMKI